AASGDVATAAAAIGRATAAFPDRAAIVAALAEAAAALEAAAAALANSDRALHGHRIARKRAEVDAALALAAGLRPLAWIEPLPLAAGGEGTLAAWAGDTRDLALDVVPRLPEGVTAGPPEEAQGLVRFPLAVALDAPETTPFAPGFSSLGGNGAAGVTLTATIGGRVVRVPVDLEEPLAIGPAQSVRVDPEAII